MIHIVTPTAGPRASVRVLYRGKVRLGNTVSARVQKLVVGILGILRLLLIMAKICLTEQ